MNHVGYPSSENRLNSILEAVDAAILTIDTSGIIVECNHATSRMFGYEKQFIVGKNVKILMPDPDRKQHDSYIRNHLSTGRNKIIGVGRRVSGLHKTGRLFPVHLSVARCIEKEKIYFTGILHDLTELDLAQSISNRLGQIIEESANEVYTFDASTLLFTSANRSALENLGYSHEEIQRCSPLDIFTGLSEAALNSMVQQLVSGKKRRISLQTQFKRRDNSLYDVQAALHHSRAFDPPELAVIVQDTTEKNRLFESLHQNQRFESIGNLTGGIAHDFNNILTVVMGNLELLSSEVRNPDNLELLEEAREAAEMGARLTRRLLAFACRSPLSPHTINVNRLIIDLSDFLTRTLGSDIKLKNNLSDSLWDTDVDVSELENALVNLVINARDAMPRGGRLLIETSNYTHDSRYVPAIELEPGDYIRISVEDTGTGIPDDIIGSIFEPFVTSKKGGKGSGLGLSMVYGFVRQSGGCVSVCSELGSGTTFSVYLPRTSQAVNVDDTSADNSPASASGKKVILVVEDDDRVRKLTLKRIRGLGHTVIEANDGFAALEVFKRNSRIDLIFTDVVMTEGMTGYDLAVAVRALNPDIPVVLTSGYAEDIIDADKLLESGLQILRKPYHLRELKEILLDNFRSTG
ncbi:hypothetical protein AB833_13090 [Chromatiales bacterium (ex Bugula neritina AB1)]|nr:hypothetical protein AB833_13090 [Chromatiales bacterium (ex Bugula neritina AB1)]